MLITDIQENFGQHKLFSGQHSKRTPSG